MEATTNGHAPVLLSHLTGVRETGSHKWQARCPAHDDKRASLSVKQSDNGNVLVKCHANCATSDVLAAVGLELSDLFPANVATNGRPRIVAEYDYHDRYGNVIFQAVRFEPKDFRQRKPNGNGGWLWSVKGCPVVPYRLPDLLAKPNALVFVCEGEKDCERLRSIGITATCNAAGAGKWRNEHAEYLTGRNVVVLPDNDGPGRKHSAQVVESLYGKAASVKLLELPGVPPKGDASDWLDGGGTADKLLELVEAAPSEKFSDGKPCSEKFTERSDGKARHTTDVGNAERFAEQHGGDVRYCHPWGKWLVWDGRRWGIDGNGEVMRRAKLTARSIYVEAAKAADKHEAEALARWASASERRERLAAMIALAQSEQPIPIAVETLDAEPWLLNVENGIIDLRTGELREHRREDYLTKLCAVEYPTEPGIDPELWTEFLNRIFNGNARLIGFLQRLVGMALVGEVLENILPIFHGVGANGKSVFLETVCGMLGGDYAMAASTSLLMVDRSGRHPTERTDLHGKRLVAANESGDGGRLSEETVKQLTSREAIRARRMREDNWEFVPSHTVFLATNHKPEIRGTDYGIWRRIHLIPFAITIPPKERDRELANKLKAEHPAILRWAVTGCRDWQCNGLQAPPEVLEATNDYRSEQDTLGEWVEERCTTADDCEARAADLYRSYKAWAVDRGEKPLTQTKFGTRLSERGFTRGRNTLGQFIYQGVGLLSEGSE